HPPRGDLVITCEQYDVHAARVQCMHRRGCVSAQPIGEPDLAGDAAVRIEEVDDAGAAAAQRPRVSADDTFDPDPWRLPDIACEGQRDTALRTLTHDRARDRMDAVALERGGDAQDIVRSEEHTSELQS